MTYNQRKIIRQGNVSARAGVIDLRNVHNTVAL
jgi:hypothetical protein